MYELMEMEPKVMEVDMKHKDSGSWPWLGVFNQENMG